LLRGERVTLRATTREDLARLARFENDLGFVLAGGGDPPEPVPLERLQRDFDREISDPPAGKIEFAIEADGAYIGRCGLYNIDRTARHAELGIGIGDEEYWGAATGGRPSACCWTTRSGSGTCAACGWRSTPRTRGASGPTARAVSSRRAGCANTSGSAGATRTT
jgi:hypothetical protein